jgi:SAM-dependent methyltransferase
MKIKRFPGIVLRKIVSKIAAFSSPYIQEMLYGKPLGIYEMEMGNPGTRAFAVGSSSPINEFIYWHFKYQANEAHFHSHYIEWRFKRLKKLLEIFPPEYFPGKKVLELGSGTGFIGAFLADLGADVLALEGRACNRNFAKLQFRHLPKFKPVLFDLDTDFTHFGRFDLIVNFGFLEVVQEVDKILNYCAKMTDNILLETLVCDSEDPDKIISANIPTESIDNPINNEFLPHPSPFYIESFFKNHDWKTHRHFSSDLNTPYHLYDWEHQNSDKIVNDQTAQRLRRFWHFSKNIDE